MSVKRKDFRARHKTLTILFSAFFIATSGLAYELISATVASYLLGDSVTNFSFSIGVYLFAMGIGSYLSRYFVKDLLHSFIHIEMILALVGGFSALLLFFAFSMTMVFNLTLWSLLLLLGTLVGIEIPLLLRILKQHMPFRDLIAKVLTLDYVGGLLAAILFPVFFAPKLGLIRTALFFGLLNAIVAVWTIYVFREETRFRALFLRIFVVILILVTAFIESETLEKYSESHLYADKIVVNQKSQFQKIVVTRWHNDFSLFLNNNLQFNSKDEYRYHEALVHPMFQLQKGAIFETEKKELNVLVLGGGDGLAVRELLKYQKPQSITLVDLDPAMTALGQKNIWFQQLNANALNHPGVKIINTDAFLFVRNQNPSICYDYVVIDFPDPSNFALGKLYSDIFFRHLKKIMCENAFATIQATSPLFARQSFWCINATIRSSGFHSKAFHAYVPSFGEWGFILFGHEPITTPQRIEHQISLKYLNNQVLPSLFIFPDDMAEVKTEIQKLNSQSLVHYYDAEWSLLSK